MRTTMKAVVFLLLIAGMLGINAFGQNAKTQALPAGIADWNGEDSSKLLNDPAIKLRLKKLLGNKSYASFMASFETITPISKNGKVLFASGCLIHACIHLESAVAIDLSNNTVHAAIYEEEKATRFFNERRRTSPKLIIQWAKKLRSLRGK